MDEWVRLMEEEIIPFQTSKGMVVTGSFRGEDDDASYIWMRRFETEADRERLYKTVYESDFWRDEIGPRISEFLERDRSVITRIVPTSRSPMQ